MYAVIKTGGKQYRVQPGDVLRVEKLEGDKGAKLKFDQVLMVGGEGTARIGKPVVAGVTVHADLVTTDRAKKIIVFKMRRRKNYRRKNGHRQPFTQIRITSIEG